MIRHWNSIAVTKNDGLNSGLITYIHRPMSYITLSKDAGTCSGTGLPRLYKRQKEQLWLISYFRQLLTTKVNNAHWTCISSTPTHEWSSSLKVLKKHTILNYTQYSPTKMCGMKNMWINKRKKTLYVSKVHCLKHEGSHCIYFVSHTIQMLGDTCNSQKIKLCKRAQTADLLQIRKIL